MGWFKRNGISQSRWSVVRRDVLERDGWRCTGCGRAGRLEVHHRVRPADGGELYALENLTTLCRPCHFGHTAEQNRRAPSTAEATWTGLVHELMT